MAASMNRQIFEYKQPFTLTLDGSLPGFQLAYEVWGRLNRGATNAILLFPGLSASAHAKSHDKGDVPGWWEAMIGPGEALDTEHYFIVCINHLGGCFGSTGPGSLNPGTGKPYGADFPPILMQDMVDAVRLLVEHLGIAGVFCTVGASMGGMLAMEYAARFSGSVANMIMISASGRPGPQSIAYRYVQRQVILNDPYFNGGNYYDHPERLRKSMAVARQIGNITYRSHHEFNARFGRGRTGHGYNFGPDFQVESYLHHMGHKLGSNFDANSFLVLSKSMDHYSLGYEFPSYETGVARIEARCLVVGVSSDILFPIEEQHDVYKILHKLGRNVRFKRLESTSGHDAFLVEVDFFKNTIKRFLEAYESKRG